MTKNNIIWHMATVTRQRREEANRHRSMALWFTGLSGAGKSTLAHAVEERLFSMGANTYVFDGDNVRHGLCRDLGFSREERSENIRRIAEMVKLFLDAGIIALTAFISPFREDRQRVREILGPENFFEIYCRCSLETCEQRDVKGIYRKARLGEVPHFTGITAPYEEPEQPDLVLDTDRQTLAECVEAVVKAIKERASFDC
ncbi:MAG: adenylyl-sulfate kinase [Proteobacteria bacterium]|nr:adenylyl-sulfate kinase [Pseudomonadota bacterium]MBU4119874.1 adenylyl-sulfate kinase [Pseudomonadota bacterium]